MNIIPRLHGVKTYLDGDGVPEDVPVYTGHNSSTVQYNKAQHIVVHCAVTVISQSA